MKEFTTKTILSLEEPVSLAIFQESALFFDIETTGFSGKHSKIYFIGCGYRSKNILTVVQYFSENPEDEGEILTAFFKLCRQFLTTITFNGLAFDIPFLRQRCALLHVEEALSAMEHIDIFKAIAPLKKVFKLTSMKQKSIEQFLSLNRLDMYTGGELINVYHEYLKDQDEKKLALMQLHNREDVLGMIDILPVLSYAEFFQGGFSFSGMEVSSYQEYEGSQALELLLLLSPVYPFPKRISCGRQDIYLSGYKDKVKLKVKIYHGELKYFYSNYKDYYYLPQEDMAVHKSVAFYVDKNFRTKAKAATCYSKKSGRFLPQYSETFSPYFKLEFHDKVSYIEMTEEFTASQEFKKNYVMHLLSALLK